MFKKAQMIFILIGLCFLVYANSLNNEFVSDDIPAILNNSLISHPGGRLWLDPSSLLNFFDYLIGGLNPFVYHLTSIILHSINTILVFFFLRLLFKSGAAFLGAVLFAVHPAHTEAVAWISGRPYLITTLFILGAYFLYRYATNSVKFKVIPYLLTLLIFSYYLMNNFSFYAVFPLFLILADITFRQWRKNLKYWLPFLAIVALRLILARGLISGRIAQVAKDIGEGAGWINPFFNLTYSFFTNLGLLLWPAKLTLYHEPVAISSLALKLGLIFLIILGLGLFFIFKKAKEIFFAIGIFALFLAPTYSPVIVSWLVAERYLYFPTVSLSIILAFFSERKIEVSRQRNNLLILLAFILAAYAGRAVVRNEDWKTPERLWRETAKVSPQSPRAHNNMGDVYCHEGNPDGAIKEFKRAIELKPDYADAYHNLGAVYYRQGDIKEAEKLFKQAVWFNPQLFESHCNLGVIYLESGNLDLAQEHFQQAAQIRPEDSSVRNALDFAHKRKATKQ